MPTNAINDTGVKYLYDKLHGEIEPVAEAVSDSEVTIEGNPLSFNTLSSQNAKSTILSLEPIQDLHGYDKPWVGGADVNFFRPGEAKTFTDSGITFTSDGNGRYTVKGTCTDDVYGVFDCEEYTFPAGSTHTLGFMNSQAFTSGQVNFNFYNGNTQQDYWALNSVNRYYTGYSSLSNKTVNKYSIHVKAGITVDMTLSPFVIEGSSPMTTFRPFANICPISGRTEIGILGCGANICGEFEQGGFTNEGLNNNESAFRYIRCRTKDYISVKENQKYKILVTGTQDRIQVGVSFYTKDDYTTPRFNSEPWDYADKEFTTPVGTKYIRIIVRRSNDSAIYVTDFTLALEEVNTDLTISLGQTVYGGTLDVENGVLVVDRTYKLVTKNTLSWIKSSNSQIKTGRAGYFSNTGGFPDAPDSGGDSNPNNVFFLFDCSETATALEAVVSEVFKIGVGQAGSAESNLWINVDSSIASAIDLQNYLENNPIQVVYELATPITINLTPHTINLLKGVNNISTTGDKIILTYRDGSVATLGDLTSAVDSLDSKIDESKILTDTATGDKYILVVSNGVLDIQQISN